METIEIGTAASTAPGLALGELRTGDMPDGEPIAIPVMIMRGEKDGPILWLHGCVHGDEYCGTFIIHELMRGLDHRSMAGAVVALPVLQITGFQQRQRMSPFESFGGGDLNRCFPGRADGGTTEQMAYAIYQPLKRYADYLIDFHTALTRDVRWALFAAAEGEVGAKAEAMARAFGLKSTLPAPMDILNGSAMIAAARDGVPSLIVECGGFNASFDEEAVQEGAERLRNVLRRLGVTPGPVRDYGPLNYFSNFAWVCATRGGLFQPSVGCGDRIEAGALIGRIYDAFGDEIEASRSPHGGIVLAINSGPVMATGDVLVHVGLDPREV